MKMLIRSQDRTKFTVDLNVYLDTKEVGTNNTTIAFIRNDSVNIIGSYSTREKAIKVLDMIQENYEKANVNYVRNIVFQMPEDSEV